MMDLHPGLMIWTIISFVILLVLLKRFAWTPILKALEAREGRIRGDLEASRRAREEAEISLAEYRRKLAEASAESQAVVARARAEAERAREELLAKSKAEAEALVERARQQIEAERQAAVNQIRAEVAVLALAAAERVVAKSLDSADHRRLIEEALREQAG